MKDTPCCAGEPMGKGKVDEWTTREDMAALMRVAEIKKDPARRKACDESMKKMNAAHEMMKGAKK